MSRIQVLGLTVLAMLAFAANSVLCRLALRDADIDAASFTGLRLLAGTVVLLACVRLRRQASTSTGDWASAWALFAYAAAFSFAYLQLTAGTGALLLFAAVQFTLVVIGLRHGERWSAIQAAGLALASAGLVWLLLPGLSAPAPGAAALMALAGVAWGVYTWRGRGVADPLGSTAGNFWRASLPALLLCLLVPGPWRIDAAGAAYALLSGGLASGLGYVVWYAALRGLSTRTAASAQLSVPAIAALGGVVLLGEHLDARLLLAATAILAGIALTTLPRR